MSNKNLSILVIAISMMTNSIFAQQALVDNKQFTGAEAIEETCRAIYQMDSGSPEIIKKTIRNINNLLKDPRLAGKVQVELIAFSGGTEAYRKDGIFEEDIKKLIQRGVIVAQCSNTLIERNINKEELFDFIAYVPTGNGELLIRANQGWIIIKP